jgi:hypothetical protein
MMPTPATPMSLDPRLPDADRPLVEVFAGIRRELEPLCSVRVDKASHAWASNTSKRVLVSGS